MDSELQNELEKEVIALSSMYANAKHAFQPALNYIRFPLYKKLRSNERIDFDFPLTVLVGQNGCNKSSILHALYGVPIGQATSKYWFSTKVDSITENHCHIHGYFNSDAGRDVEVLQQRSGEKKGVDYWESSRPVAAYNMEPMPESDDRRGRTDTRWNAITKKCLYLDFRSMLSAYDKCFYFADFNKTSKIKSAQDFIRSRAKYLYKVIKDPKEEITYYKKKRVLKNEEISKEYLADISDILGYEYTAGRILEHSLYSTKRDRAHNGITIQLKRSGDAYTEAFAGSGEFSVAHTVYKLCGAPEKSLILLDEPEVSLHPRAQTKLLLFILRQIKLKKHQVVMATHSPFLFKKLPPEAIKVLSYDNGVVTISNEAFYDEASSCIGLENKDKINVVVEDRVAQMLVEQLLEKRFPGVNSRFSITYSSGGAGTIMTKRLPVWMEVEKPTYVLLDGDQRGVGLVESRNVTDVGLDDVVKGLAGGTVEFYPDSGDNKANQLVVLKRTYIDYCYNNLAFLPLETPEEILWVQSNAAETNPEAEAASDNYKEKIAALALQTFGDNSAQWVLASCKMLLTKVDFDDGLFDDVSNWLESLLDN